MQVQLSTEFALHGLLYLAAHPERFPIQLPEIAAAIKVKESYLRKLFQQLVKSGILEAYKGSSGGYALKLDAQRISFLDVLEAIEGIPVTLRCYSKQRSCELHPNCPITQNFGTAFQLFFDQLRKINLAQILNDKQVLKTDITWMHQPV